MGQMYKTDTVARVVTDLSTPIWFMQDDAKNFRVSAAKVEDEFTKQAFLDRANQCELAAKILEAYVKHSRS